MSNSLKTLIVKQILHINTEDVDFLTQNDFFGEDFEDDYSEIYKGESKYLNTAIKIDTLRKHLDQLEQAGSNYVSIEYNTDHKEYELDGQLIALATQEEIDEENNKEEDFKKKYIQEQLSKMEKDRKYLEDALKNLDKK